MNVDLNFDQAQYGILASIGFAAFFSLTSLVAGGIVDRVDPRAVLGLSSLAWAGAMGWQAAARSFSDVLASRFLLGFAQAFTNPASYTALGKLYAPEKRASAFGVYSSGVYIGGGVAALSILLIETLGWRGINSVAAAIGAAVAIGAFLVLPSLPPSGAKAAGASSDDSAGTSAGPSAGTSAGTSEMREAESDSSIDSTRETDALAQIEASKDAILPVLEGLQELFATPSIRWLLLGSGLRFMAGFCIGVWIVPFYREAFPAEIGVRFALLKASVNGIAGAASAAGGGFLTDKLSQAEPRTPQWLPAAGCVLAIPFWLGTLYADSLELSLAALFVEYLVAECWFGPTIASLQKAAPPGAQGLAQGVFSMLTLAGNLAPAFVGYLVQYSDIQLPEALSYTVPFLYISSALAFLVAGEKLVAQPQRQS